MAFFLLLTAAQRHPQIFPHSLLSKFNIPPKKGFNDGKGGGI